jgi:hypothetical protein
MAFYPCHSATEPFQFFQGPLDQFNNDHVFFIAASMFEHRLPFIPYLV